MTDVQSTGAPARLSESADTYHVDPGRGWVMFAGIMLLVIGVLNVVYGIAAIDDSTFYVRDVQFVLADLQTWGWILLIVGIVQLVAAFGVFTKTEWGRWLGIALATGNAVVQFFVLPAHPVWAIMVFFVDIIIIFGLLTYGGRDRYSLAG
jgi:uncharacterized membrane protein HdeD (DUF308 family)